MRCFFFFSSRRRHTRCGRDWSSDVCSSDLGRARSLEEQVAGPIEAPDEMGQPLAALVAGLAADPSYAQAFRTAFPDDPRVSAENLAKAITTFERTLVSPKTRFDRWIEGDDKA